MIGDHSELRVDESVSAEWSHEHERNAPSHDSPAGSPMSNASFPRQEWLRGWKVLTSATAGYGAGSAVFMMAGGLFVAPMQRDLGWSASAVTILPIVYIMIAICTPFTGMLVDRFGARRIAIAGLLLLAAVVSALAFVPPSKPYLYLLAGIVGLVAPLSSAAPFLKGVASWFKRSAGAAIGIAASGSSIVALFALPLVSAVIFNYGWRAGYLGIAGIVLVAALPVTVAWFREHALASDPAQPSGTEDGLLLRDAVRRPQYWLLIAAITAASVPLGGFLISLVPILVEKRFSITAVTSLGMVFAVGIIVGRVGGGVLLDRFQPGRVAAALMFTACSGGILLAATTPDLPYLIPVLAVAFIGMGHGAETDLIAYFALRLFGLRAYSTIFGTIIMVTSLTIAAAGSGFALCKDMTGSYMLAIRVGAACHAISGIIFLICFGGRNTGTAMRSVISAPVRDPHLDE